MSDLTAAGATVTPEPTAIEPSRVLVLNDQEQHLLIDALNQLKLRDAFDKGTGLFDAAGNLQDRIAYGDEYINETDELARVTLRKRRLEGEVRRCNNRIESLEPVIVEDWTMEGQTGIKHAGTGASLSLVRKVLAKLEVDTTGLDKDAEQAVRAEAKAVAAEALEKAGLGHLIKPDFNFNTLSALFREEIRNYDEEQQQLPEHQRVPRPADSFLPEALRGLIRIDDTPHIQVRS